MGRPKIWRAMKGKTRRLVAEVTAEVS